MVDIQLFAEDALGRDASLVFVAGDVEVVWLLVVELGDPVDGRLSVDEPLVQCKYVLRLSFAFESLVLFARKHDQNPVVLGSRLELREAFPHGLV